ncbi:MAG: hypothetical protein GXO48_08440 [Chlorobi bacterium]|nr:hypothetical protein [Chlorobiota bacterium]
MTRGKGMKGLAVALGLSILSLNAQDLFYVVGGDVYIQPGADVYIYGGLHATNSTSLIQNNGQIFIRLDPAAGKENWTNNASPNLLTGTGTVYMEADGPQEITGTFPTTFYDLVLGGAGTNEKWLRGVDMYVQNTLNLTDEILYLDTNTAYLLNPSVTALSRTGAITPNFSDNTNQGIIVSNHSTRDRRHKGYFARAVQANQTYFFPVGDTTQTTKRFRPILFKPVSIPSGRTQDTIFVRFVNIPPATDQYDPNRYQDPITTVGNVFYWLIHSNGESLPRNDTITVFYNDLTDGGYYKGFAHWNPDSTDVNTNTTPAWTYKDFQGPCTGCNVNNAGPTLSYIYQNFIGRYDPFNYATNSSGQGASWVFTLVQDPILPLEFIFLKALPKADHIQLQWTVPMEGDDVIDYELYRSDKITEKEVIHRQSALGVISTHTYTYEDHNVEKGVLYEYVVKATLTDGTQRYSNVATAMLGTQDGIASATLMDNRFDGDLSVLLTASEPTMAQIAIYDATGRLVWFKSDILVNGGTTVKIPDETLARGMYNLQVRFDRQGVVTMKVLR